MPPQDVSYGIDREELGWQGLDLKEGLAEGDGVIDDDTPVAGWTQKANGVGGVVQIYNPAGHGTLTIKISHEHRLNLALRALHNEDRLLRNVVGPVRRVRNSGEVITYDAARIARLPKDSVGSSVGDVTWEWIFARKIVKPPETQLNTVVNRP